MSLAAQKMRGAGEERSKGTPEEQEQPRGIAACRFHRISLRSGSEGECGHGLDGYEMVARWARIAREAGAWGLLRGCSAVLVLESLTLWRRCDLCARERPAASYSIQVSAGCKNLPVKNPGCGGAAPLSMCTASAQPSWGGPMHEPLRMPGLRLVGARAP